ncbi:hypothetical protein ACIBU0_01310 [Streptomyces sp. NPDC049627]|uniref:hypothetical protein n=1 Tax=Streptomyces sp. NPDC049627 TaxID=3365595 RepID=UPI00378C2083
MPSVNLIRNIGLSDSATGPITAVDGEPTAARFLDHVFVTGNVYASRSQDGGSTWTHVDPFATFPFAAGGLCCDQMTLHERSRNLWIWLLQYNEDVNGSNIFRLAVSTTGSPAPGSWFTWDFHPGLFDTAWATQTTFDRPDIATTSNHLYITYNVWKSGSWTAALVFKISLTALAQHQLSYVYYTTTTHASLCLARGATSDMYFMAEAVRSPVRIFRWPDADGASWSWSDVSTPGAWTGSTMAGSYTSLCPSGVNWLGKLHARATAGWVADGRVGFLWHALPTSAHPQPWIKGLVVDATTMAVLAEPDIWNPGAAFAYPATCPNANGVVGISLFFGGGGAVNPRHVVGYLDPPGWVFVATRDSTDGPYAALWGDYLSCTTKHPNDTEWVATGYTLQGGTTFQFIEPQYVEFGVGP